MRVKPIAGRPFLLVADFSDGPSGLSKYLEILWPLLSAEFNITILGDPDGPFADYSCVNFIEIPHRLRNTKLKNSPVGPPPESQPRKSLFGIAKKAYGILAPVAAKRTIGFLSNVFLAGKLLSRHRCDVIYMPLCGIDVLPFAAFAARLRSVAVLHHLPPRQSGIFTRISLKTMLFLLDKLVAVSHGVAVQWKAFSPGIRNSIVVIHNGIKVPLSGIPLVPSAPTHAHCAGVACDYVFLAAGRLVKEKGFEYLIDACAILRSRRLNFKLLIAGDGPLLFDLRNRVSGSSLGEHVFFLGQVSGIDSLYRQADCFVLSSISEAMPYVLLEAMSHGVPVIATTVGGVKEIIAHQVNGLLCEPGSSQLLADSMELILSDPESARRMSVEAIRTIEVDFSADKMISKTIALLKSVASQ